MAFREELINVGDWEMKVRTDRATPDSLYTMQITQIRSDLQSLPDWADADNSYRSHEDAVAAARKWGQRVLK